MSATSPAFRYHGAKFRIAPWVVSHFPAHRTYVEPFGGAAGVLLTKAASYAEVYNDLDGDVVNFFQVLQDDEQCARLVRLVAMTPYARREFDRAWEPAECAVERARRMLVRASMGFGSAGATKGSTGFRVDTQRNGRTAQQVWADFPESIGMTGARFAGVLVENRPAIEVMQRHDTPDTLHYVDPPYLHNVRMRGSANGRYYRHEMSDAAHLELLEFLRSLRGMVVLSGYPSELYDNALPGWQRTFTTARISAGRGGATRTECLWLSPSVTDRTSVSLFSNAVSNCVINRKSA